MAQDLAKAYGSGDHTTKQQCVNDIAKAKEREE